MQEFIEALQALRTAQNAEEFVGKEKTAFKAANIKKSLYIKFYKEIYKDLEEKASPDESEIEEEAKARLKKRAAIAAEERLVNTIKGNFKKFKAFAYECLDADEDESIEWIDEIQVLLLSTDQVKQKKAQKKLAALIKIISMRNIASWETVASLRRQITLTKSFEELKKLRDGAVIEGYQMPSLEKRFDAAKKRDRRADYFLDPYNKNPDDYAEMEYKEFYNSIVREKFKYLNKKKFADQLAKILNVTVCILGIGMLSALAFVAILPVLNVFVVPFAAIGILAGASLVFSYTEEPVFYAYIQKFWRQFFVGFFKGIDNTILNRRAYKEFKKRDRHALLPDEIDYIKKKYASERYIKYALVGFSFIVSAAAGFGFLGLLFTEIAEVFTALGFISVATITVMPWVLAAIAAPIYAMVTAGMLYKAIKNNYFEVAINHIKDLFSYERVKEKAAKEGKPAISLAAHVGLCLLKSLGLGIVLAFSFVAVFATAGLWIQTNINFLTAAVGVIENVANILGWIIGGFHLFETLWFCVEKSLGTVNTIFNNNNFKEVSKETFSSPKKFFMGLPSMLFFACHLVGNAAVAILGALSSIFNGIKVAISEMIKALLVGSAEIISEAIIDAGDTIGHAHHSAYEEHNLGRFFTEAKKHHHDHDGHSHGNIVKSSVHAVKTVAKAGRFVGEGLGIFKPAVKEKPRPLQAFELSTRSSI